MKKLLLILLCLPMIGFGQNLYNPQDLYEKSLPKYVWPLVVVFVIIVEIVILGVL